MPSYPTSAATLDTLEGVDSPVDFPAQYTLMVGELQAVIDDLVAARDDAASLADLLDSVTVELLWDVTEDDYLPIALKGSSRPKRFTGVTDPQTVPNVVLNDGDVWRQRS